MFSKCNAADPCAAYQDFYLWEITGRWVSPDGAPAVTIYRNTSRKRGRHPYRTYIQQPAGCL